MKLRGRNKVSPEFSMSSMTDIVFLLLVFFMLTSNSPNALDLLLPKAKGKSTNTQNVAVSIKKNLEIYIDADRVRAGEVEAKLQAKLKGQEEPTVILRAEEGVPIEEAVNILDIANRNKYKIILAVRPQ
ncbi:ExbD/TolR family protein [Kordia zhangzhouensis]|uniref:ExbD/TolR family protein n=1 Tax=Kordia zhangzhouensis TaxID=1620405 RepID=UPI00062923CA|nr:biopolymer transporter ExbD [Kordia zhangzhouensis]